MVLRQGRRSVRLAGHDYAGRGWYFITLCTQHRIHLFGRVEGGQMTLNDAGQVVMDEWSRTPQIRPEIELGPFVVMPNHFHGIVQIHAANVGAHGRAPLQADRAANRAPLRSDGVVDRAPLRSDGAAYRPPRSLGAFIAGFKSAVTTRVNALRGTPREPVWQRNFHEHIIRDEAEWVRVRDYIDRNPADWERDELNS